MSKFWVFGSVEIEELEMTGGGAKNYQFKMQTENFSSNGTVGSVMSINSIATANTIQSSDPWDRVSFRSFDPDKRYCFVCFPDNTYSLNSAGTIYLSKQSKSSDSTYDNETHSIKVVVSEAEKCPDNRSNGKNIWRCNIQPDIYRTTYVTETFGFYGNKDQLYVTFGGGSVSKVTP